MTGYPTPEMRARMAAAPGTPPAGPAGASSANTEPRCAHCGEPLTGTVIREFTGLTGGPGRSWHGDRDACKAAAFGIDDELDPVIPTDADVLRDARREALLVLLSRAGRGVLSVDEGELLRHHVEAEIREGDQARELAAHDRSPDGQPSTVVVHLDNRNATYEPWPASDALSDTSPTPDGGLREQIESALANAAKSISARGPEWTRVSGQMGDFVDAVLAVRDRRMEHLRRERDLAIAHDRQPYPTAWAYEQACTAREEHRERADTAEAEVRRLGLMVDEYGTGASALSEKLRAARAEIETADRIRADAQRDRDQHAAVLRHVLDQFANWPAGGTLWPEGGVVAKASTEEWDRWNAVVAPTAEQPWWEQVTEERTRASVAEMRAERTARTLGRVRGLLDRTRSGQWIDPAALRFIFDTQDPEPAATNAPSPASCRAIYQAIDTQSAQCIREGDHPGNHTSGTYSWPDDVATYPADAAKDQ